MYYRKAVLKEGNTECSLYSCYDDNRSDQFCSYHYGITVLYDTRCNTEIRRKLHWLTYTNIYDKRRVSANKALNTDKNKHSVKIFVWL